MRALTLNTTHAELDVDPAWIVVYTVEDFPLDELLRDLARRHPGVPVFGTTSFRGMFSRDGFARGASVLAADKSDDIRVEISVRASGENDARMRARQAADEIAQRLGRKPDMVLMHATPGFEERILEGIEDALGRDVEVYGGSAADDEIAGRWKVFGGTEIVREGFVLAGFVAPDGILGGFLGGYLPTHHAGRITRAQGRTVYEIDGRPAAVVYNEWSGGAISDALGSGGGVLLKTNLMPIGRVADETLGMPLRLLSHPHEVVARTNALKFFGELKVGDEVVLMTTTPGPLVRRMEKAVQRAFGARRPGSLKGGLFIYCGGCLAVVLDQAADISSEFQRAAGDDVPFVGVATFGEQGCFVGKRRANRHGNLMCNVVLFK